MEESNGQTEKLNNGTPKPKKISAKKNTGEDTNSRLLSENTPQASETSINELRQEIKRREGEAKLEAKKEKERSQAKAKQLNELKRLAKVEKEKKKREKKENGEHIGFWQRQSDRKRASLYIFISYWLGVYFCSMAKDNQIFEVVLFVGAFLFLILFMGIMLDHKEEEE